LEAQQQRQQQQQQKLQQWQHQQLLLLRHKECALEGWQNANGAKTMHKKGNHKPAEGKGNSPLGIKPQSREYISNARPKAKTLNKCSRHYLFM